jgi:hypothetical protein
METRNRLIQALGLERDWSKTLVLDFFLLLSFRLKENLIINFKTYASAQNLQQILWHFPLTGFAGRKLYHFWRDKKECQISEKDLQKIAVAIFNQLNPDRLETHILYEFADEYHFLIILAELINHVMILNDSDYGKEYIVNRPAPNCFTAPIEGTFYWALSPNAPSLVSAGDEVEQGQDIGVIVVSKTNNYITAEFSAQIISVLVSDNTLVQAGQPLFQVQPLE